MLSVVGKSTKVESRPDGQPRSSSGSSEYLEFIVLRYEIRVVSRVAINHASLMIHI